jgi:hypothetical protein
MQAPAGAVDLVNQRPDAGATLNGNQPELVPEVRFHADRGLASSNANMVDKANIVLEALADPTTSTDGERWSAS